MKSAASALLSVPEAAKRLGISESSMWVLIRNRAIETVEIPSAKAPGRKIMRRVEESAIDAFIATHRQPAAS
jgi:predicted DNA-binding transcriptional regulator AlpA